MLKEQKGITLIALVITIIVLLILAGVSIAMLTGSNGILNQANDAKANTNIAEVKERINVELNAIYAEALAGRKIFDDAYITTINKNLATKATATLDATNKGLITITGTVEGKTLTGSVDATPATPVMTAVQ